MPQGLLCQLGCMQSCLCVCDKVKEVLYLSTKSLNTNRHCSFWITRACRFASADAVLQSALVHKFMLLLEVTSFFWCYVSSCHSSAHRHADEFLTNQIQASGWTVWTFRQPLSNQFNSRHCPHPQCEQQIFFWDHKNVIYTLKPRHLLAAFLFSLTDCYRCLHIWRFRENNFTQRAGTCASYRYSVTGSAGQY